MGKITNIVADDVRQVVTENEIYDAFKNVFCKILHEYHQDNAKSYREKWQKFWLETQAKNYDWKKAFDDMTKKYNPHGNPFSMGYDGDDISNRVKNDFNTLVYNVVDGILTNKEYFNAIAYKFFYQIQADLQANLKDDNLTDKQICIIENRLKTVDLCLLYFLEKMNYIAIIYKIFDRDRLTDNDNFDDVIKETLENIIAIDFDGRYL